MRTSKKWTLHTPSTAKLAALLGTHESRVEDIPSKISLENTDTVSQAAMLPKQSFHYLLSCTSATKVLLWITTTFCIETFITLLAEYFTTFNVCILPKYEGQNWEGHNWCHTTLWPENKVVDGGTSFRKPWTSCIQAALESEAAHLESTVSAKRQRPTAVHRQHNTARRRTAHLCMDLFHALQRHDSWSWANAPCTTLSCAAQKGQSLLKVTLFIYRNYGKCAKPKLLKMASLLSPCFPLPWLSC